MKFYALIVAAALNPLVTRAPEPRGPIPANCEVSDRPAMPRVSVAQATPDEARPLPPIQPRAKPAAAAAMSHTKELQRALAANDRAAFDAALTRARAAGVPTRVYDDIARLWDAQFESPFFSEGSDAHRIASNYPGYEAAVRRQVFTDATGRKFYPAAESRAFVAQQVGVSAPARATAAPATRHADVSPAPRTPSRTRSSSSSKPRNVARRAAAPSSSPDPSTPRRAAATNPAPVVPPADEQPSPAGAPPAAGSLPPAVATDTALDPVPATDTSTTVAAPAPAPAPVDAAPAPAKPASRGRSIVLPAVLILIGLGVLILLFRTAR